MQGSFTPIRNSPYATSGQKNAWATMKDDMFNPTRDGRAKPAESMAWACSTQGQSWTETTLARELGVGVD